MALRRSSRLRASMRFSRSLSSKDLAREPPVVVLDAPVFLY